MKAARRAERNLAKRALQNVPDEIFTAPTPPEPQN